MTALLLRRPVATVMFFIGIAILGLVGWSHVSVELLPALGGNQLFVKFMRLGSEPEVVEREILLPLEAAAAALPGVVETRGVIQGSSGTLAVKFDIDTNHRVRELDLARVAAELARSQPEGSFIDVSAQNLSLVSRMAMVVQVVGGADADSLRTVVEDRIQRRLLAVPGVSQVIVSGGAARGVVVWLDSDRATSMGVSPAQVIAALRRSVRGPASVGGLENEAGRQAVLIEGQPENLMWLGEIRIDPQKPVLLRHVADIEMGTQRRETIFRVNGQAAVGLLVFQDEAQNLVELGRNVRQALARMREEFRPQGLDFVIGFDAARAVEKQLQRLEGLALSGFLIALLVLYLFLRDWRAVAVVAVAVPMSLLAAGAMMYLGGWSLNLITLFGFAVGTGLLVDNSIVVYEAVQRGLERGVAPTSAAINGVRRTARALLASCATNAVVFLPCLYITDNALVREVVLLLAITILLPTAASLLIAIGLVPLLAQRLAAPAAAMRIERTAQERIAFAGLNAPHRARDLFGGLLKVALRNPLPWLGAVAGAVLLTVVIAIPWVLVGSLSQQARVADQVQVQVEFTSSRSLQSAAEIFGRLERAALDLPGVQRVESSFGEAEGTLTVHLADAQKRPTGATAGNVHARIHREVADISGVNLKRGDVARANAGGDDMRLLMGGGDSEVLLSGPDMGQLSELAEELAARLRSIPAVGEVNVERTSGQDELLIRPNPVALADYGVRPEQVFGGLRTLAREGVPLQVGYVLEDGREIPIDVRAVADRGDTQRVEPIVQQVQNVLIGTANSVVPTGVLAFVEKSLPPQIITHRNGRREVRVSYQLRDDAPASGPVRAELEAEIQNSIRSAHHPTGYTVEIKDAGQGTRWFTTLALPALLLLYAVLAIAFESPTLPVLILLAVPLTALGATWALVFTGMPADMMALVGVITLLGVTVNPAILLVDRMQTRARTSSFSSAAAAIGGVKERTRPVLMTSCATVAGLWPLAIATGREFEIWPSFATVVIGGLLTSTLLTLLVIPVGFVILSRIDRVFGRLGPWLVLSWLAMTGLIAYGLFSAGLVTSPGWQFMTTLLIGGGLLALLAAHLRRPLLIEPDAAMNLEVRFLSKTYGEPGPVAKAWHRSSGFAQKVLARGGQPVSKSEARAQTITLALLVAATGYLAFSVQTASWRVGFTFACVALFNTMTARLERYLGRCDALGRVNAHGAGARLRSLAPWLALAVLCSIQFMGPLSAGTTRLPPVVIALLALAIGIVQSGRRAALRIASGTTPLKANEGRWRRIRTQWRSWNRRLSGLDVPHAGIDALSNVSFNIDRGMVGILGPNGAGKTTLLRLLAGVLTPSIGTIRYGGVNLKSLRSRLANWVGYLPQEYGLPEHLTAQEYLDYFAVLYDIGDPAQREERVRKLLSETGLAEQGENIIGTFSGGMRQRVGIARALLREPPVIIVDEPTVGLDPHERIRFRNLLARLATRRVVLFSTHVVEDVAVSCDRVIVMRAGRVVYDDRPGALADLCRDSIWEARLTHDAVELDRDAMVVDRVPQADGRTRTRILCRRQPHPDARLAEPTLEDGYLSLVSGSGIPQRGHSI